MLKTICIMCPMGCNLEIQENGGEISVKGNTCKRGETYGKQEYIAPKRMVTSLVSVKGGGVVPVKTTDLIDKNRIFDVLNEIKKAEVKKPVKINTVVIKNILGLGVDIITTKHID